MKPLLCLLLILVASEAYAQAPTLRSSVSSSGAVGASTGGLVVQGTIGGMPIRSGTGGGYGVQGGFWVHVSAPGAAVLVAAADTAVTEEDVPVSVRVLENDVDPAGDVLTLASFGKPEHGTVEQTGDSTLTYQPNADFFGEDSFVYGIQNAAGETADGLVLITVTPVNDAPTFVSEPVDEVAVGEPYRYDVETYDPDPDSLSLSAATLPEWLALSGAAIEGTPNHSDSGEHDVVLRVSDGALTSEQAFTITVTLTPPAAPVLTAPDDGATGLLTPVALAWSASEFADSYHLQVALRPDYSLLAVDSTDVTSTEFELPEAEPGKIYYWRVRAVNAAGAGDFSTSRWFETSANVATEVDGLPATYRLDPNYPNPFNPSTSIRFALPKSGRVSLRIFDVRGREVARLLDGDMPPGIHDATWDCRDTAGRTVPSGVYFYRLDAGSFSRTRSMVLLR